MLENQLVVNKFTKGFRDKEIKRIVVYGLSKNSELILNSAFDFECLGLMDGFIDSGEFFGYPILSQNQVAILHPDAIVIIARKNSTRIIAKRIEDFCRNEGISLYDMEGNDLLLGPDRLMCNHPYFKKTADNMLAAIDEYDIVSFDIFDTLIMRRTLYPKDVFSLVEMRTSVQDFSKCRENAERKFYQSGKQPKLSDIYRMLQNDMQLSDELCQHLLEDELSVEQEVTVPRKQMVQAFQHALQAGKQVWLISDMYLPSDFIKKLCGSCGIDGYDRLIVSCEYGMGKTQGLFEKLKLEVKDESWLHIGDSKEADHDAALAAGVDVFPIYSALDMACISSWQSIVDLPHSFAERFLLGSLLSHVFNSPFDLAETDGRPVINSAEEFGEIIFGPVLTALFYWIKEKVKDHYDVMLWGARDGYLLDKMHRMYQKQYPNEKLPRAIYYYTSRMAAMAGYPTSREDIKYMAGIGFAGTAQELLIQRFHLSENEILPLVPGELTEDYVLRHEKVILARAKEMCNNALKYWASLEINASERIAFFDLFSSGTCHLCTQKMLGQSIDGFYLIHVKEDYEAKDKLTCCSFIEEDYLSQLSSYISSNYEPIETVAMSFEPSLMMFESEGNTVFGKEKRTSDALCDLQVLHKGVLDYFYKFVGIWGTHPLSLRTEFVDVLYGLIRMQYTNIQSKRLSEQIVRDDFTNRDFVMNDMFD